MTKSPQKPTDPESSKGAGLRPRRAPDAAGLSVHLARMLRERLSKAQDALAPVLDDVEEYDQSRPLVRKVDKQIGEAMEIAQALEDLLDDAINVSSERTAWRPLVLSCLEKGGTSGAAGAIPNMAQVKGPECFVAGRERVLRRLLVSVLQGLAHPRAQSKRPVRMGWQEETPTADVLTTLLAFGPLYPGPYVRLSITGPENPGERLLALAQESLDRETDAQPDLSALMALAALRALQGGVRQTCEGDGPTTLEIFLPATSNQVNDQSVVIRVRWEALVLDGNEMVAETTRRMLERGGYRAFATSHMDQALVMLDDPERLIGCLIMDVRYADRYLEWLNDTSHPKTPPLAVILTGDFLEAIPARRLGQLACRGFLRKPFNSEALLGTVHTVLLRGMS